MMAAKLVLDWRESVTTEDARRHSILGVANAPAGAVCAIWVDYNQPLDGAVERLLAHCSHLTFEVWCSDASTLKRWLNMLGRPAGVSR